MAIVGAATLLLAGVTAIAQHDIKRVLAYSTISQIGYMFLALGVGAWSAAMFHFMTHALFKALLFLGAGVVILAMHHEQNMFKMGGLRKMLPLTFWTLPHRLPGPDGPAPGHRRLVQQGPDPPRDDGVAHRRPGPLC